MKESRLLFVDEDADDYGLRSALDSSIERLNQEGFNWAYELCRQHSQAVQYPKDKFDALLIDNDFGQGLVTLTRLKPLEKPVAYVSAYDMNGLIMYHDLYMRRIDICVNPQKFDKLGIRLIRKRGRNVGVDVSPEDTQKALCDFLREAAIRS